MKPAFLNGFLKFWPACLCRLSELCRRDSILPRLPPSAPLVEIFASKSSVEGVAAAAGGSRPLSGCNGGLACAAMGFLEAMIVGFCVSESTTVAVEPLPTPVAGFESFGKPVCGTGLSPATCVRSVEDRPAEPATKAEVGKHACSTDLDAKADDPSAHSGECAWRRPTVSQPSFGPAGLNCAEDTGISADGIFKRTAFFFVEDAARGLASNVAVSV